MNSEKIIKAQKFNQKNVHIIIFLVPQSENFDSDRVQG